MKTKDRYGITKFYGINGIFMRKAATELRGQPRSQMKFGNEGKATKPGLHHACDKLRMTHF